MEMVVGFPSKSELRPLPPIWKNTISATLVVGAHYLDKIV